MNNTNIAQLLRIVLNIVFSHAYELGNLHSSDHFNTKNLFLGSVDKSFVRQNHHNGLTAW